MPPKTLISGAPGPAQPASAIPLAEKTRLVAQRAISRRAAEETTEDLDGVSIPPPPPRATSSGSLGPKRKASSRGAEIDDDDIPPPPSPQTSREDLGLKALKFALDATANNASSGAGSGQDGRRSSTLRSVKSLQQMKPDQTSAEAQRENMRRRDTAHLRGWDTVHAPTSNPFLLRAILDCNTDPWKDRALYLTTPNQMSSIVENFYCTPASARHVALFTRKPTDTIICGVPRSGQMPIIHALHSLKSRTVTNVQDLPDRVPWLEAPYATSGFSSLVDETPRIVRTHMPIRYALDGDTSHSHFARLPKTFKVVVVLRDPLDLRLAWFRHVRRIFGKFHTTKSFDQYFHLDDFAKVPRASIDLRMAGMFDVEQDYEHFIMEVIRAMEDQSRATPTVMLVFYEEILTKPESVVRRLAEFTGHGAGNDKLIAKVTEAIQTSTENPKAGFRKGASGGGKEAYAPASQDYINARWLDIVKVQRPEYASYAKLYEHFTGDPYPFRPASLPTVPSRRGSFLMFRSESSHAQQPSTTFHTNTAPSSASQSSASYTFNSSKDLNKDAKLPRKSSTMVMMFRRKSKLGQAPAEPVIADPDDTSDDEEDVTVMRVHSNELLE